MNAGADRAVRRGRGHGLRSTGRAALLPRAAPPLRAALLLLASAFAVAAQQPYVTRAQGVPAARVARALEQARATASLDDAAFGESLAVAYALVGEGRHAEAAELFAALAAKRPRDFAALYGAALSTFNAGRAAEALPLARRAVDAALTDSRAGNSRAADALVLLAVVEAVGGDEASALKNVRRAVELAPDNFDAQLALGRALYGAGDDAGAFRAFRAALALRPGDARTLFFLATSLERAGDDAGALAAYRELATRQPRAAEGHLGLGVMLVKRGGADSEEGLMELARALELDPNAYEARVTLGRALLSAGRAEDALPHLRRAAELAPDNPEPHYQLSLAYRRLGRRDEAAAESAVVKRIHESRRAPRSKP
jgi:tetratricopeptide (TPR) repeat protein